MQNKEELKKTLIEVRKAYRLLYSYQRGVLDLVNFIGTKLGFQYRGGFPIFSDPTPKRGKGKLKKWSWDWLNFYFYEFNFLDKENIRLSVFILSNTGFFDTENCKKKVDVDNFASVDSSKTKLIFAVGQWKGDNFWKNKIEFIKKDEGNNIDSEGRQMFYKHYNLEDFLDEKGAESQLEDFINFCKKNNIDLELQDKV